MTGRQRLCLTAFLPFLLSAQPDRITLENQYLKLQINPVGGRIEKLHMKERNLELTSKDGLLGDNFYHVPDARFFLTRLPYRYESGKNTLLLHARHSGGGIDFMDLKKNIRLPQDEAMVTVDYKFTNLPAAMADVEYGYWCQNFIGIPGKNKNCFFPCMNGIVTVPENESGSKYSYYKQPSRGWIGFAYHSGGGLTVTMDYALVKQFYGWFGESETTQEWYFDKIRIPNGKSLDTVFELIPFHSLKKISGAGGGLVGEMNITRKDDSSGYREISLQIYSAKKQSVRLEVTTRHLREGKPVKIAEHRLDFDQPCTLRSYKLVHRFMLSPALFDVEARAYDTAGKLLAIFNAPVGINTETLAYRMQEEIKRNRSKAPQIDLGKFDNTLETPHIKWAKPLSGGKIRMLGLTPFSAYRELAELAQRLDIELTSTLWLTMGRPSNVSGEYFGLLTESDIMDNLDSLLLNDYDVILLAGVNYDKLSPAQRKEIIRKVENGCGLILVGCHGKNQDILSISPLAATSVRNYPKRVPQKAMESYLTTAVPWDLIPPSTCFPCEARGDVYVKTGAFPYLAMREHGAGRVIALSCITGAGQGKMVCGLTPDLPYPLPGAAFRDYFELYHLMLAKAVVTAAKRDRGYQFGRIEVETEKECFMLKINFKNRPSVDSPVSLTLFTRNRDNEVLSQAKYDLKTTGQTICRIPAQRWNGRQLIGMILRNAQGEVLDFGAVSGELIPSSRILRVSGDKEHYQEGENAVFTVDTVSGTADSAGLSWSLSDAWGRTVAAGVRTALARNRIAVPVVNSLKSRFYRFSVELSENKKTVDRFMLQFSATPSPGKLAWDDYEAGLWITPYSYDSARSYLHPFLAGKMREMKISTVLGNTREVDQKFAMFHNFNPTLHQGAGTRPARLPREYHQNNDKMLLQRNPCLSSPDFRARMQELFLKLGQQYRDKGLRYYWFGDELSLTGYWSSSIDYCFSPSCLTHFRQFLLDKYGSLEAVNRQWGTAYRKPEEILPETAGETRKRKDGNHSAWADHLEYMDHLLCDYINAFTIRGLRKGDPDARGFISGPQGPAAYGGNDWRRQSQVYSGLMSYPWGGLQEILHSFNPQTIDLPWILGYANYGGKVCYELWKSLQVGAKGAMGFAAANMINPDYTLSRSGKAAARYLPEITSGIGKLVLNALAERPAPEILIVYSQPSIRAAFIEGRARTHENLRWKYITLCRNFGIPFRFAGGDQIENGILDKIKPKAVIFPDIDALSARALAQIGSYLRSGGKILIDGEFAGMDASCRKIPGRQLPDTVSAVRPDQFSAGYYDAWCKPRASRDENDRFLLNRDRRMFGSFLKSAEITPLCRISTVDGNPFLDAEIDIMSDRQGNRYVMVISKEETPTEARLEFNSDRFVRHIRNQDLKLADSNPLFMALLPEKETQPLRFDISGNGRDFTLHIDTGVKRDTVIRLSVINPQGGETPWYCTNLNAPLGKVSHKMQFALNDLSGKWKLNIREIVSGRTASADITLK